MKDAMLTMRRISYDLCAGARAKESVMQFRVFRMMMTEAGTVNWCHRYIRIRYLLELRFIPRLFSHNDCRLETLSNLVTGATLEPSHHSRYAPWFESSSKEVRRVVFRCVFDSGLSFSPLSGVWKVCRLVEDALYSRVLICAP